VSAIAPDNSRAKNGWGRRRESNAPSANYDLAALPLSYTGPRCRTLCDSLASYNQNVQPARTSCPSCGSTKFSKGRDCTEPSLGLLFAVRSGCAQTKNGVGGKVLGEVLRESHCPLSIQVLRVIKIFSSSGNR
jgi:hypothetical protein